MTISLEEAQGLEQRSDSDREEPSWLKTLSLFFLDCTNALPFVSENIRPLLDFSNHHLGSNRLVDMAAQQDVVQYATYVLLLK